MDQQVRNNTESTYGNAGVPLLGFSGEHKKPKGSRSWCSAISCHTKNEKKAKTPKLLKKNPSISETIRKRSSSVPNHSRLNLPPLRLKAPQQEDEIQSDELMDVGQAMMENEAIITTSNSLVSGMALPPALQHTRYERAKTAGPEPSNPAPVATYEACNGVLLNREPSAGSLQSSVPPLCGLLDSLNDLETEVKHISQHISQIKVQVKELQRCVGPNAVEMATGGPVKHMATPRYEAGRPILSFSNFRPPGLPKLNLANIIESEREKDRELYSPDRSRYVEKLSSPRSAFSPRNSPRFTPYPLHPKT